MNDSLSHRRLLAAAALVALGLVVVLGLSEGPEELRDRGVWPWGDAGELPPGIQVELPADDGGGSMGAAGAVPAPGPDGTVAGAGVDAPLAGGVSSPDATAAGTLQVPNARVAFGALVARAGGANSAFVYRAAVEGRDAAQYARAVALFDAVADGLGPLAPFAKLRAAQMTALLEDAGGVLPPGDGAAERFAMLLVPNGGVERLPVDVQAIAWLEGARALEHAGRDGEALVAFEQAEALPVSAATRAEATWEQARLLEATGVEGWAARAAAPLDLAPGSPASVAALDLLDEHGAPYPGLAGAYVAYRSFRNDDAVARYEALLDSGSLTPEEQATAWFYLGALRERAFAGDEAIDAYAASLAASTTGRLAPDARYWRGRVLEELGRPAEAAAEYDLLVADYPSSGFVEDARLRAAVALGLAGDGAAATARLASITQSAPPAAAAEAAHWHTVLVSLFDAPPAEVAPATAYDPGSYAAAFEQAGEAVTGPLPARAFDELATAVPVDRVAIDVWLAGRGVQRGSEVPVLRAPEVELAWLLAGAGEAGVARGLLHATIDARRGEPHELVALALEAQRQGLHDVAMRAAEAVLAPLSPSERLSAPVSLLTLAYPVPYLPAATAAAEEFGVPVLLLYALMRQESAFHPEAGSSAGAFGLTQVIPATGEYIAAALGEGDWRFGDLARPAVAARFGAYYLAAQLDAFEGHMLAALAAYNGGPGNASRWLEAQEFPGPDGYLYAVDFTETRTYLETVSSNYAIYRYLYLGLDRPQLPHG